MPLRPGTLQQRPLRLLLPCLLFHPGFVGAQSPPAPLTGSGSNILQQRYDLAQRFQSAHELPQAAEQYRIFLADGLGELAMGFAQEHLFQKAADPFDEALRLVPDFPMLRLQYARAALEAGKLDRAKTLASEVLASPTKTSAAAAGAHEVLGRALLRTDQNADARKELEQAVSLDSTFGNGYELAVADLNLGDEAAAEAIFREMLKAYGDKAVLHMYFGRALGGSDFQGKALSEFQIALRLNPKLPGLHYCLAAAYLAAGESHTKEAESELRQEIAVSPGSAEAYAALGHLLAGQATTEDARREAERLLLKSTELNPGSPDGFLYLGQVYAEQNRSDEAIKALRTTIELTTDPSRNGYQVQKAHYLLGRLLLKSGQTEQGQAQLALSQELMHNNLHRDQNRLSSYLTDGVGAPAVTTTPEAASPLLGAPPSNPARVQALQARLAPAFADSYNNLGAIAAEQNNFQAAVVFFRRAAEWNPRLPGLDFNWGRAAFAAGNPGEAIGPLQRYVKDHPDDIGARSVLGLCLFSTDQYGPARDTLSSLQGATDLPAEVRFAYADSVLESGDVRAGLPQLEALAKSNPGMSEIHAALGRVYASSSLEKARAEFEEALRLKPEDGKTQASLGRLELEHGEVAQAVAHLQRALESDPRDPILKQQLDEARRRAQHR